MHLSNLLALTLLATSIGAYRTDKPLARDLYAAGFEAGLQARGEVYG